MNVISRYQKWIIAGVGTMSGAVLVYYNMDGDKEKPLQVSNSLDTLYKPYAKWDYNWDRRDPKSLVKPSKQNTEEDENKYNEKIATKRSTARRNIILIRHGQYNQKGKTDAEKILTDIGREQAEATGKRLAELHLPFNLIVKSTLKRAQETSEIIEQFVSNVEVISDSILAEGAPIPPEPPLKTWRSEKEFFQDGPRIEAAFRKYFHRADPSQKQDSYTILVCHANVIRYFVCRALQFPPEAWIRICLFHGSITWLCIYPNGKVSLYTLGDIGHLPPKKLTAV